MEQKTSNGESGGQSCCGLGTNTAEHEKFWSYQCGFVGRPGLTKVFIKKNGSENVQEVKKKCHHFDDHTSCLVIQYKDLIKS